MTNGRAARLFRLAGKTYAKGDPISLPENQFRDLEGVGLVKRTAAPPRALIAKAATRRPAPKRKPAVKKAG